MSSQRFVGHRGGERGYAGGTYVSPSHGRAARANAQRVDDAVAEVLEIRVLAVVKLDDPWSRGFALGVVSGVRGAVGREGLDGDFRQGEGGWQGCEEGRDGEVLE